MHAVALFEHEHMASILEQLTTYAVEACAPAVVSTATRLLALFYYSTLVITILLLGYGLSQRQAWATWLGIGLTIDALVNAASRALLRGERPIAGCGSRGYGMPADVTQHAAFFVVAVSMLPLQWYMPRVYGFYYVLAVLFLEAVALASVYFHFNSVAQVLVGSALGSIEGALWTLAYYVYVYPRLDAIMSDEYVHTYYPLVDTISYAYTPVDGDPEPLIRSDNARKQP